jgi:hypothetical protein
MPRLIAESLYRLLECVIKHPGAADTTCVTSHDTTIDLAGRSRCCKALRGEIDRSFTSLYTDTLEWLIDSVMLFPAFLAVSRFSLLTYEDDDGFWTVDLDWLWGAEVVPFCKVPLLLWHLVGGAKEDHQNGRVPCLEVLIRKSIEIQGSSD